MLYVYEGFFLNLCVLISSLFVYKQLFKKEFSKYKTKKDSVFKGFLAGVLGIILMYFSIDTGVNSIIDLRIIPLMLIVLYSDWISAFVTVTLIIFARFVMGINAQSFSNVIFILFSWLIFQYISKKMKNRWVCILVMLGLSSVINTLLSILIPLTTTINIPLLVNYSIISILGGLISVYVMDYLIKSEELFMQHKNFAFTDPLTGLNNVRSFDRAFNEAKRRQMNTNESLSIMIIDIDCFKQVNDTYGHLEGDKVLIKLATLLKSFQGPKEVVSRNGGEEFSVLVHNCTLNEARERAEILRKIIENSFFIINNGTKAIQISVSIGVTTFSDSTKEMDNLYDHADQALYIAKRNGGNKVTLYS
ncbi:GGDEF domain-containing protein [Carnobacterium sp. TMP28]|uniref:GGDEF domain-containing protein n=1 Tax=Carnobacterium sp. TMP28 TaxID=3397060 RepID=UPI0039E03681